MLKICRINCEQRGLTPKLFLGKMESFSFDIKYEAIIVPTGTFLLLHNREDSIRALKNFYNHLSIGGKLILDIFLQTDLTVNNITTKSWETSNGDIITLESKLIEVDHINQFTISHHCYEKLCNGELIETELELFPLRWYGVEEFKLILLQVGFEKISLSANYNYGQFPTQSDQIITFKAIVN